LFLFYIKSQSRATKQVLAATAGLFTPNGWEYAGKPCSLINQLQNVVFLNLIAMESNDFDRDFGVLVCCILMPNSI
jgi:hypothetical protein